MLSPSCVHFQPLQDWISVVLKAQAGKAPSICSQHGKKELGFPWSWAQSYWSCLWLNSRDEWGKSLEARENPSCEVAFPRGSNPDEEQSSMVFSGSEIQPGSLMEGITGGPLDCNSLKEQWQHNQQWFLLDNWRFLHKAVGLHDFKKVPSNSNDSIIPELMPRDNVSAVSKILLQNRYNLLHQLSLF